MQNQILQFPFFVPPQKYQADIQEIKSLSTAIKYIPLSSEQELHILHLEVLKSALFSARIEGNQLTLVQSHKINLDNPKEKSSLEISNILQAIKKVKVLDSPPVGGLNLENLKDLHTLVMQNLSADAGSFRSEAGAIYDGFGNIVYLTPEPKHAKKMLAILLEKINSQENLDLFSQLVLAAQCHYYFEKIHPFIDGNGRVGRLLLQYQLQKTQLLKNSTLPIEEYFEKYKADYYYYFEKNTRHIEGFVTFFIKGIIWSLEKLLSDIKESTLAHSNSSVQASLSTSPKPSLLPRRQEIVNIITDHAFCSLDFISRRFPTISKRTIAYDVNQLVKKEFVIKHGTTRGVRYSAKKLP